MNLYSISCKFWILIWWSSLFNLSFSVSRSLGNVTLQVRISHYLNILLWQKKSLYEEQKRAAGRKFSIQIFGSRKKSKKKRKKTFFGIFNLNQKWIKCKIEAWSLRFSQISQHELFFSRTQKVSVMKALKGELEIFPILVSFEV